MAIGVMGFDAAKLMRELAQLVDDGKIQVNSIAHEITHVAPGETTAMGLRIDWLEMKPVNWQKIMKACAPRSRSRKR